MGVAISQKSAKQQTQALDLMERANRTVQLGLSGLSMNEIAKAQGISLTTVKKDYERLLQATMERRLALGNLVFHEHLSALELKIAKIDEAITTSTTLDTRLYDLWLRFMNERAKLLDLYPKTESASVTTQNVFVLSLDQSPSEPDNVVQGRLVGE